MSLYPENKPFESGFFDTGDGHSSLYYERHGNPRGRPVVYLHGGPGAGCSFQEYRMFNPNHFNVLIFDQRGAGKSRPHASIDNNSISHLVGDIDRLRQKFGHQKWSIAGGSWGSALAMFYATQYPQHVDRMILRGVFFADQKGACHIIEEDGIAKTQRNTFFDDYLNFIPLEERQQGLSHAYYNRLTSGNRAVEIEAATLFNLWDASIVTFAPHPGWPNELRNKPEESLALSRTFFHFAIHEFDDKNRSNLLAKMSELTIPINIIHGRQDYICPVENAEILHKHCPGSTLQIFERCGHSQKEEPLLNAFLKMTDRWMKEDSPRTFFGFKPKLAY